MRISSIPLAFDCLVRFEVPARSRLMRPASKSRFVLLIVHPAVVSAEERLTDAAPPMLRFFGSKEKVSFNDRSPSAFVILIGMPVPPPRSTDWPNPLAKLGR